MNSTSQAFSNVMIVAGLGTIIYLLLKNKQQTTTTPGNRKYKVLKSGAELRHLSPFFTRPNQLPKPWKVVGNLISTSVTEDTVLKLYARETGRSARPYEYSVVLNESGDGPRILLPDNTYYDLQNGDSITSIDGLESIGAWTVVMEN